jgi:hypothetical protein
VSGVRVTHIRRVRKESAAMMCRVARCAVIASISVSAIVPLASVVGAAGRTGKR